MHSEQKMALPLIKSATVRQTTGIGGSKFQNSWSEIKFVFR